MRARILTSLLTVAGLALAGSLAAAPPAQADGKVIAVSGSLTNRPSGLPPGGTPAARQLGSASVRVVRDQDLTTATVALKAAPTSAQNAYLRLTIGEYDSAGKCEGLIEYHTQTYPAPSAGWSRSGATYTLSSTSEWLLDDYDCAFAAVASDLTSSPTTYDLLGGTLHPEYAQPALQVTSVALLGKPKLKLVPGVWTKVDVEVRNTGAGIAKNLTVSGSGKGVKVRPGSLSYDLYPNSTGTVKVQVKLKKRAKGKLNLVVSSGAAAASTTVKVKPAKAPPALRAGTYRSKDKSVTFRVKRGKVVGFRVRTQTTCGGYPDFPTYTMNWYDMPTFKLPKSGVIDVTDKGDLYTATLEGRASGKKVKATFRYSGPDRCRATEAFVAKRAG
ncbi:hypothetical protein [Nocardioides humi]|uniref:CARDB domain-containing protein n=1 Tax=Nocardioides humi TaxID=449461 RepID=A0ABN2A071_9ACTN|nr:hypothetical protein [Nocardioides humi]